MASPLVGNDADAVIGAEYEAFKDEVTRTVAGKLAASKIRFAELDMDGFYNQAWYGLYTKLQDGQTIDNRKGLLVQMTYRRAIDEYRTLHPDRHADPVVIETVGVDQPIEETLDQQREFGQFVEAMRSSLSQRELTAATLCYVYGLSRPEAAEQVGVRPKRMEKIMDEVSRKMRPLLASIKEGNWCEDRALLINQYALGALDPESDDYAEAVRHLESCPGCRRHVLGARGLTAVTIPSALFLVALGGLAAGGTAGAAAGAGAGAGGGSGASGGGSAFGGAAAVAAVVAAVVAVAAGGFFVIRSTSGGGESAPAQAPAGQSQNNSNSQSNSASESSADSKSEASKATGGTHAKSAAGSADHSDQNGESKGKEGSSSDQQSSREQAPAAPAPPPSPRYTPEHPSKDSGSEFDLQ